MEYEKRELQQRKDDLAWMKANALIGLGRKNEALTILDTLRNKMRTILRIGLANHHDSLVLGALGCGAFCNPPSHVARLFHEVIDEPEFAGKYRLVVFAILEDGNSHRSHNRDGNYKPFADEFS